LLSQWILIYLCRELVNHCRIACLDNASHIASPPPPPRAERGGLADTEPNCSKRWVLRFQAGIAPLTRRGGEGGVRSAWPTREQAFGDSDSLV
jgi:hypothetical protein